MGRLKLFIVGFFITVSIPLAFVIWQTYSGLEQEEKGQLRYFSEAMFDRMEKELSELIEIEENRAVDEYGYFLATAENSAKTILSPLAKQEYHDYILGYLQNNPDGSFQTPLVENPTNDFKTLPPEKQQLIGLLREANTIFNQKKLSTVKSAAPAVSTKIVAKKADKKDSFSERYLTKSKIAENKQYLGKKQQRLEEVTAEQVINIMPSDKKLRQYTSEQRKIQQAQSPLAVVENMSESSADVAYQSETDPSETYRRGVSDSIGTLSSAMRRKSEVALEEKENVHSWTGFQVEVAPFQSVSINKEQVYIFRRIAINNQIYRQGFILKVKPLLQHLAASHFERQPLATYTSLNLQRRDTNGEGTFVQTGAAASNPDFRNERIFPAPFNFLSVSLSASAVPKSPARGSLNIAIIVLTVFMVIGLLTIYQSARTIVAMSERRSQFVSSVTHELKTPLTNIRMYIEMLEQGIAATPEREQEYLAILGSESSRLSGLINNVLDLAKLEKKQRQFHMQPGHLDEVFAEVASIMAEKLKQSEFTLNIQAGDVPEFVFDRAVVIQLLTNLIENSIKFGQKSADKEISIHVEVHGDSVRVAVSDTGPGIPQHALKKVFDDFYRVDNDLTRATGGTGIGLALVKKFMIAMGGSVKATNNNESGCTITLQFPYVETM